MSFLRCTSFLAVNVCAARQPRSLWLTSPATRNARFLCQANPAPSNLQPPDVARLAETARITLSPQEAEDLGPKIRQVIDWFGQLQAVNLEDLEPALRADTEAGDFPREDTPEIFENRKDILAAVPKFDDPYIKVPKVLNIE